MEEYLVKDLNLIIFWSNIKKVNLIFIKKISIKNIIIKKGFSIVLGINSFDFDSIPIINFRNKSRSRVQ